MLAVTPLACTCYGLGLCCTVSLLLLPAWPLSPLNQPFSNMSCSDILNILLTWRHYFCKSLSRFWTSSTFSLFFVVVVAAACFMMAVLLLPPPVISVLWHLPALTGVSGDEPSAEHNCVQSQEQASRQMALLSSLGRQQIFQQSEAGQAQQSPVANCVIPKETNSPNLF